MPTLPLRPINAIFVHQENRYYVVLMQGDDPENFVLYRVTRMKLDSTSWARKTPYTGSFDDIYLVKNQRIDDAKLQQILPTYDLPTTLHGKTLTFFLSWWQTNGYDWIQNHSPIMPNTTNMTDDDLFASNQTATTQQTFNLETTRSSSALPSSSQQSPSQSEPKRVASTTSPKVAKNMPTSQTTTPVAKPTSKPDPASAHSTQSKSKPDTTATQNTPANTPVDDDFFDNLLAELNDL